jgi:predicted Zn-dependent protease
MGKSDEPRGRALFTALAQTNSIQQGPEVDRVSRIVKRLSPERPDWRIYLFRDDGIQNASCAPGRYLFVWSGIFSLVRNDDELAAIIAHEMAHLSAAVPSETGQLTAWEWPGSRSAEDELAADAESLRLLASAGYRPEAALEFWLRYGATHGPDEGTPVGDIHPSPNERAANIARELVLLRGSATQ